MDYPLIDLGAVVITNPAKDYNWSATSKTFTSEDVDYFSTLEANVRSEHYSNLISTLPASMSFRMSVQNADIYHVYSPQYGLDYSSLLYVPSISDEEDCGQDLMPANVTKIANLPPGYNVVAFAPLTSPECAQVWMLRAERDSALGLIFYGPEDYNTNARDGIDDDFSADVVSTLATPNASWIGGVSGFTYSVLYLTAGPGAQIVQHLSDYSGNMTGVPYGTDLVNYFDFRDYVRVVIEMQLPDSGSKLPQMWVFLTVACAGLAAIAVFTLLLMHYIHMRRRERLRIRIQTGEVDLETLGVKRLTVPKSILEQLPVRVYGPGEAHYNRATTSLPAYTPTHPANTPSDVVVAAVATPDGPMQVGTYAQATCPICLDDFEPYVTKVRELPCMHIYHTDCIDNFLQHQSSLCPLCKQSALPRGYIPPSLRITNATVRRERRIRNAREDVEAGRPPRRPRQPSALRRWFRSYTETNEASTGDIELDDLSAAAHTSRTSTSSSPPRAQISCNITSSPPRASRSPPEATPATRQRRASPATSASSPPLASPPPAPTRAQIHAGTLSANEHAPVFARDEPGAQIAADGSVVVFSDDALDEDPHMI
ncbi:uncharacterized protein V1518DRAFT_429377 [Limtongia smithiae]|uniref:uncharacterized protein n=1 Tax=Limtongia smithiae TaxID=1125753 RepID=UPI0034D01768